MRDGKFKELVKVCYTKSKEANGLFGLLYGAISTVNLIDIEDIDSFVEKMNPDMLHLKSMLTGVEKDIYEWELKDFRVKEGESTIYVLLKNGEVGFMY